MRKYFVGFAAMVTGLALMPAAAGATSFQVTTLFDTGGAGAPCTLREAVTSASSDGTNFGNGCGIGADPDSISFDPAMFSPDGQQTINLGSELPLASNVTISGPGAGELALDGQDTARVLGVISGNTVGINGLTVQNGRITGTTSAQGGGIFNSGNLTLTGVVVSDNTASATAPAGAHANADGGGIYNFGGGSVLTLDHSSVEGNEALASNANGDLFSANARGAGIGTNGELHVHFSRIDDNHARADDTTGAGGSQPAALGAGIFTFCCLPALEIDHSSVTRNLGEAISAVTGPATFVNAQGGGIFSQTAGTLETSTVSENKVDAQSPTPGFAVQWGGVSAFGGGTLAVISSTIARNGWTAGADANFGPNVMAVSPAAVTLENSIVASPVGPGSPENCSGTAIASNGFNIDFDANAGTTCDSTPAVGDQTANPLLAASLAFNGATTESLAPMPGSPALDAGLSTAQALPGDQRGLTRPVDLPATANATGGNGSDIGAYEEQLPVVSPPGVTPPAETGQRAAALKKCKKKKSKKAKKKCKKKAKRLPV